MESKWLSEYQNTKPFIYRRCVDDIFAVFSNQNEADEFLNYLNSCHENIKFTIEYENNKKLSFLDVLLNFENDTITSVFHKKK